MKRIKDFLNKQKIEYYDNFDCSIVSSMKLGGVACLAIFPNNQKEFEKLLLFLNVIKSPFEVFGNSSNILVVKKLEYPIIFTSKMTDDILIDKSIVTVSAGVLLSRFCDVLKKNNLSGFEGLVGIPATVGGALINNAGAYGYSISDRLVKVKVFKNGKIFDLYSNEIKFGYHFSNLKGFIVWK